MTADEYLAYLIRLAQDNITLKLIHLQFLQKLMRDDRTGRYTP